jgi:hypothetical protein
MTISNVRKLIVSKRVFMVVSEARVPENEGRWFEDIMWLDSGKIETFLEFDLQKASIDLTDDEEKNWPNAILRAKLEIEKRRKK